MDLCEGMMLFDMINSYSKTSEEDAKCVFQLIMPALKYLHSKGISYGDIKKENIICN
jgi:serine/threonine protein kinase